MAQVTNWLKWLRARGQSYEATMLTTYNVESRIFDLVLQSRGRVMRVQLELNEITSLYGSILNYLNQAKYPSEEKN